MYLTQRCCHMHVVERHQIANFLLELPLQSIRDYWMYMCKVEGLLWPLPWKTMIIYFLYLLHLNSKFQTWNMNLHD